MDHMALRDADSDIDLESGDGTTSEEDASKDTAASAKQTKKALLSKGCNAFVDQSATGEYGASSWSNVSHFSGNRFPMDLKVLTDQNFEEQEAAILMDKETVGKKNKKKSAKKAPKPPRPPRGPSLDAADQKLIREINELALLKRARIERVKALKKMKATKPLSSSSNLFAMVFTILFFLIIFFQGMSTRSSQVGFHGSPESAAGRESNFISIQYYRNASPKDVNGPDSSSLNLVERVPGQEPEEASEAVQDRIWRAAKF